MPEEQEIDQDKEQEIDQEIEEQIEGKKQDLIKRYSIFRENVSLIVGLILLSIIISPLIYGRYLCRTDSTLNIISGYTSLFLTVIPLFIFGLGLILVTNTWYIALGYLLYYYLIFCNWCHSYIPFIIILIIFAVYFFYLLKARELVNTLLEMGEGILSDRKKNLEKK